MPEIWGLFSSGVILPRGIANAGIDQFYGCRNLGIVGSLLLSTSSHLLFDSLCSQDAL